MSSKTPPNPTGRELDIMRVLWKQGPSNVRQVLDVLNDERDEPLAYTTVLRFLQIMFEKGLVERDPEGRSHIYRPTVPAQQTKSKMVRDLMDRAFSGSPRDLVLHLLGEEQSKVEDLSEIRKALQELEQDQEQENNNKK